MSKYFREDEFRCKCCGQVKVDERLLKQLDLARGIYGAPMRVTSGYRCPIHNAEVGGVANSYHTQGLAADIVTPDGQARYRMLRAFLAAGFRRVGLYRQGFIHVDIGPAPVDVVWLE